MLHAVTDHIYNPDTWVGSGGGALLSTEGSISLSALNNERLLLTAGWRMTSSRHTYMSTFPAFPHWSESSYEQRWAVRNGIREKNSSITYPSSRSDVGCNALNNKRSSDKSPASGINQCFNCTLDCKPHTAWGLNCSCHHNTHTHSEHKHRRTLSHRSKNTPVFTEREMRNEFLHWSSISTSKPRDMCQRSCVTWPHDKLNKGAIEEHQAVVLNRQTNRLCEKSMWRSCLPLQRARLLIAFSVQ